MLHRQRQAMPHERLLCLPPAPVVECISPAPAESYAAPAPVGEYFSPAPAVHVAPDSIVEYIASPTAGHAGPAPAVEHTLPAPATAPVVEHITRAMLRGMCKSKAHLETRLAQPLLTRQNLRGHGERFRHVCVVNKNSTKGELRRPNDPAGMEMVPQKDCASGRKRGAVAREVAGVQRRLVACLPVGASAKKKTESLREMQSTLKAFEKEWRRLFNEELANLELDLCVSRVPTLQQWATRKK